MRRELILGLLLIGCYGLVNAQFLLDTTYKNRIFIESESYTNSNSVPAKFVQNILFENELSKEDIKKTDAGLPKNIRFGSYSNFRLGGFLPLRNSKLVSVSVENLAVTGSSFSKDFFTLYFRGNKPLEGKHAQLNHLDLNSIRIQKVDVGYYKADTNTFYGGGISLCGGTNFNQMNIRNGDIYTAPDGEYIDMKMQMNFSHVSPSYYEGYGAGLFFYYEKKLSETKRYKFSINDLGLMSWKNVRMWNANADGRYSGLNVGNLLSPIEFSTMDVSILRDSLGINETKKTVVKELPFRMNFEFNNKSWGISAGYIYLPGYFAQVRGYKNFKLNKHFTIIPAMSIGGFGIANLGLKLSYQKEFENSKLNVNVGSNYLDGFILPNTLMGQGVFLEMLYFRK